jgi:hypothetical protein
MTLSSIHFFWFAPLFLRLLLLLALLQPAWAYAQFDLGVVAQLEHINNPLRQISPDEDELLSSVTVTAQLDRQTKWFTSQINYSINKQEFAQDILNDRTFLEGAGSLTWNMVPELFAWTLTNTRSNQLIDASQPDVLDNRQVVDYTGTGPSLRLPLDRANYVSVSAQVGAVDFGEFDLLKHKRNTVSASYTRLLDQRFTLSIQSSFTGADYSSAEALSSKVSSVQGELQFDSGDLSITTVLGRQSLERAGVRSSSPIRRLDVQYRVNTRLALTAAYADSVEDLLSDLTSPSAVDQSFVNSDIEVDGNFGSTNAANIYQRRERSVGATYTIPSSYSIGLRYSNNVRKNVGLVNSDNDERLSANLAIPVGNRLRLSASIEYASQFFAFGQFTLKRTGYRVGVNYRVNDRLSLFFSGMDANQQNSELDGRSLAQNISLGLSFTR